VKLLITGANGMLGHSLCQLYYKEHKVYALHRDTECFSHCTFDYRLDLTKINQLKSVFNQIKPDIVIHCAGMINMDSCEKESNKAIITNVTVAENIASLCSNHTKLIYISTDQVYGKDPVRSEKNTSLQPINNYGKTKLLGEEKVQEYCSDYMVIRTNIFGWNVKPNRISSAEWIYQSLQNEEKIILFTDYIFSPLYSDYLGGIIMELIEIDYNGIINVGSSKPCSKYDFGQIMAIEGMCDAALINKGTIKDHVFEAKRYHDISLDIDKLSKLLGMPQTYVDSIKGFLGAEYAQISKKMSYKS
jgi:dTDP-4-dehydrorhamnose reductase